LIWLSLRIRIRNLDPYPRARKSAKINKQTCWQKGVVPAYACFYDLSPTYVKILYFSLKIKLFVTAIPDQDPDLHKSALVWLPGSGSAMKAVRMFNTASNRIELTSLLGTVYSKNELKEKWLWFRHNRLTEIPAVVYRLVSLTTLYMRFNRWGSYFHIPGSYYSTEQPSVCFKYFISG
jgi:hypothetical protein